MTPTSEILRQNDALSFVFTRADNYILPPSRQILSTDLLSRRIFSLKRTISSGFKVHAISTPDVQFHRNEKKTGEF